METLFYSISQLLRMQSDSFHFEMTYNDVCTYFPALSAAPSSRQSEK